MEDPPKFSKKFRFSLYIIIVSFSIIRWILTCIDKKLFDFIIILDLFLSILLIISFSVSIFAEHIISRAAFIFVCILSFFIMGGNTAEAFFTYKNSKYTDFKDICIFIIIFRGILTFPFVLTSILL